MNNGYLPDVRSAIDDYFADMEARPSLRYKVLAQARGVVKARKKLSAGVVMAIVFVLVAAGAVAAVLLSMRQVVEEKAIPMANQYEGETYTVEDTNILLQLAQDNGIHLSDETKAQIDYALSRGEGYF